MHSNNGKTLTAIFSGWEPQNIAQLYFQEEVPESIIFSNFFRIRDLDIIKRLLGFSNANTCGKMMTPCKKVVSHYASAGQLKTYLIGIFRKINNIKLLLRDLIYGTGLWRSKLLVAWLDAFSPDSIFFVGGNSIFSFNIANSVANSRKIPIDIYITDDYVLNANPKGYLGKFLHRKLTKVYKKTFKEARYVFVIGDDMAESFSKAFNRNFIPVMNSVVIPKSLPRNDFFLKKSSYVDIVYAGGLHLGRDQSLANFGKIIQAIPPTIGLDVKLTVYSSQSPSSDVIRRFNDSGVIFGGALDQDQVQKRFLEADFVLHVESFDEKYVNLTKLSVSTKIPEYLASGACLIAYGPSELASIRLIEKNNVGICLSENNSLDEMRKKLVNAFSSEIIRESLVRNGFDFAKSKFDAAATRAKMAELLNQ